MNILIVDDDRFAVSALQQKMDWPALHIDQVHTAYNMYQAQKVFLEYQVDIMICDIEMPQGSGLELLSWIRSERLPLQVIFLTNYADFHYAQKAIELQSFDYYLKPIEFEKVALIIEKAVRKVEEEKKKNAALSESRLWRKNKLSIQEYFWSKIVSGRIFPSPSSVSKMLSNENLPYNADDLFLPVFVNVFTDNQFRYSEDRSIFEYGFINIVQELFSESKLTIESVTDYTDDYCYIIIVNIQNSESTVSGINSVCGDMIDKFNQYFGCDICCIVGQACRIENMHQSVVKLADMNDNLIECQNRVFSFSDYQQNNFDYIPPDIEKLNHFLDMDDSAGFLEETERYLQTMMDEGKVTATTTCLFRLDIIQIVYSFLSRKEILAHELFFGKNNEFLYTQSLKSIDSMQKYIRFLVSTAIEYKKFTEAHQTVAEQIKQYIQHHYSEDLSRNKLVKKFFLNPDYLTRIFKRETNYSLVNYITNTRIDVAKDLLKNTDLPVNTIATNVGYDNYSHFSHLFKERCGCSPKEYRKLIVSN